VYTPLIPDVAFAELPPMLQNVKISTALERKKEREREKEFRTEYALCFLLQKDDAGTISVRLHTSGKTGQSAANDKHSKKC
jgi:hypothetical protein